MRTYGDKQHKDAATATEKTDRIIKTSSHYILSVKLHVDLDVGNVEYIVSFFVILAAASF